MQPALKRSLLLGLLGISSACTTIHDISEERVDSQQTVGQTLSAPVGEVMLDRFRYRSPSMAQPLAAIPAAPGRLEVRAGTTLVARQVDGETAFCTRLDGNFACFYDANQDSRFDQFKVVNLGIASSKQVLQPEAAYTRRDAPRARGFKYELLYLGRSDAVINLAYREYRDDLSQPRREEDLHYTLNAEGPTEIRFRAARLKILQADNTSIQYEVLADLSE